MGSGTGRSGAGGALQCLEHLHLDVIQRLPPHAVLKLPAAVLRQSSSILVRHHDQFRERTAGHIELLVDLAYHLVITGQKLDLGREIRAQRIQGHAREKRDAFGRVPIAIDRRIALELECEVLTIDPLDAPQAPRGLRERLNRMLKNPKFRAN